MTVQDEGRSPSMSGAGPFTSVAQFILAQISWGDAEGGGAKPHHQLVLSKRFGQCLIQIRDDIVGVFNPD